MTTANDSDLLGVAEVARELGLSPRQVRNLIADKLLRAEIVGGSYVVRRGDLKDVPKNRKPGPKPKDWLQQAAKALNDRDAVLAALESQRKKKPVAPSLRSGKRSTRS